MKKLFFALLIISISSSTLLSGCSEDNFGDITSSAVVDTADSGEKSWGISVINAEQVSSLKANMTYREIINTLGDTTNFGILQMSFYYVDGYGVLSLAFENEGDVCKLSGKELLDTVVNLDYQGKKFDSQNTKYGYVVGNDKRNFFICCENNIIEGYYLGVTDSTNIKYANGAKADKSELSEHYALITWDSIDETYPAVLSCTKITIYD